MLYNKDCLEFLKEIKDCTVDLILTDPPYDISKDSGFSSGKLKKFTTYKTDFGDWDHCVVDMPKVISELFRVLKKSGTLICFYDLWKVSELKFLMETSGFSQIRFIEYLKTNPVPVNSSVNYLTNCREIALTGVKGTKPTFNSKYDNGVYEFPICQDKGRFHPTQKPLKLFEALIQKHSNENDLVLDCFSGSGTTALACLNLNRRFIGTEINPEYFEKSLERIKVSNVSEW